MTPRDWWEDIPRDQWTAKSKERRPEITDKHLRDFMRWQEEAWAMREMNAAHVKRARVYR